MVNGFHHRIINEIRNRCGTRRAGMICLLTACMIAVPFFHSCEDSYYFGEVDCSECYTERPGYGLLWIKITVNDEHREVPVTVYREEFEKKYLEYADTLGVDRFSLELPADRTYSVSAEYKVEGKTILAIDGDRIKTSKVVGECDETCWVVIDGEVNVRLKYP